LKTLALRNGDLIAGPQGHETISGAAKISTELGLALGEAFGHDRFHPSWGSTLASYVGLPISSVTPTLVKAEVNRVVQAYIQIQQAEVINDAQTPGARSRFSTADVVSSVSNITAQVSFDTIYIALVLRTMAGETVTLSKAVSL
jgi:phage baseplate assembly protein W